MMRRHELLGLVVLVSLAATGCSRLTFVKPKMERGNYTQVAPDYTVRDDPGDNRRIAVMDRVAMAEQRLRAGQLDEAATQAQAALKLDPRSPDAYTILAVVQAQRGNSAQAGGYYAKAAELAPGSGAVLNNYGTWMCDNGKAAESLALFDRALADPAYPTPAAALANSGSCALTAGQTARADRDLRRALEMDPASPVALAAMADIQYRAGRYMDARAFSERRLAAAPATAQVLLLASQIEQKLGDTAASARYVQRIRTEFPQSRDASPGDASQ